MFDIKAKKTLTLTGARKIAARAAEKAMELKLSGAIAVVDDSGSLIYLERLEGTMPAAANIAIGKAATAVAFMRPTKSLEEMIQEKRMAMLSLNGIPDTAYVPLMGAYPIYFEECIVGAVSVAGAGSGLNDEIIASYAAGSDLE